MGGGVEHLLIAVMRAFVNGQAPTWRPSTESIVANAQATIDEARRHIAAQAKDAETLDTKASALITITSGVVAFALGRAYITTSSQAVAAITTTLYLVLGVTACFQAIRPRRKFSYGASPAFLADLVAKYPHWSVMQQLAASLGRAREENVGYLDTKQGWYERALLTGPFLGAALAAMAYTGAFA